MILLYRTDKDHYSDRWIPLFVNLD